MFCVCVCESARTMLIRFAQLPIKINLFIFPYRIFLQHRSQTTRCLMMFVSTDNIAHNTNTYRYIRLYGANYNLFRLVLYNRLWTLQKQHRRRRWRCQSQTFSFICESIRSAENFICRILSTAISHMQRMLCCSVCVRMMLTQSCAFHLHFIAIKKRFSSLIWY